MSHRFWAQTFLCALVSVPGVALAEVKAFPAKGKDVWSYRTYQWLPPRIVQDNQVVEDDPVFAPMIRKAVNQEMASRGFQEVKEGGDLTVVSAALVAKSAQLEGYLMMWGMDWWWGYHPTTVSPVQRTNERGMLFVNLVETASEQPVWGGYVSEGLPRKGHEYATVEKAAGKLFKKLPKKK